MKKLLFSLAFFLVNANYLHAQKSEDSVKLVINKMFAAMKASDPRGLAACFADSAVLQTVAKNKEGKVSVRNEHISAFTAQIASITKGDADERITYDVVKVDADLAIAWTPYQFYYKGAFSHCGVNSFQLVRINNEWKIQYIIDTRRKSGCL
jgi:ketosteroid isomerase-like protein